MHRIVSAPIRGLFNLTERYEQLQLIDRFTEFPSPSGDYLI